MGVLMQRNARIAVALFRRRRSRVPMGPKLGPLTAVDALLRDIYNDRRVIDAFSRRGASDVNPF